MSAVRISLLGTATLLSVAVLASPQSGERTNWDGVFTRAQAERGAGVYAQHCALCHGPTLAGGDGPPLTGVEFSSNWNGLTVGDLSERIRTAMPPDSPGKVSAQERADLIAHLLSASGSPSGEQELSRDQQEQRLIRIRANKP